MRWVQAILIGLVFAATGVAADKKPPTEEQLTEWFGNLTGLAGDDTPAFGLAKEDRVLHGVVNLIDHPKDAVPFLRKKLKPVEGPEAKAIDGWVKDYLGSDTKARDAAEVELRKHREDYLVVQKLLKAGQATESQPLRYRVLAVIWNEPIKESKDGVHLPNVNFGSPQLIGLLRRSNPPWRGPFLPVEAHQMNTAFHQLHFRGTRGVLVLERIGTPEAVDVLKEVAGGREGLPVTTAAKETLERLKAK